MPEIYCQLLKRKVDGGYCAFVCELPESEKKIVYNPVRGIQTECSFGTKLSETEQSVQRLFRKSSAGK